MPARRAPITRLAAVADNAAQAATECTEAAVCVCRRGTDQHDEHGAEYDEDGDPQRGADESEASGWAPAAPVGPDSAVAGDQAIHDAGDLCGERCDKDDAERRVRGQQGRTTELPNRPRAKKQRQDCRTQQGGQSPVAIDVAQASSHGSERYVRSGLSASARRWYLWLCPIVRPA